MDISSKRNIYGFSFSAFFHLALILFIIYTPKFNMTDRDGEIYETLDNIEVAGSNDPNTSKQSKKLDLAKLASPMELFLGDDKSFSKFMEKVDQVDLSKLDLQLENKPKVAPIVNAPAIKPVLISSKRIPYPKYGGGVSGIVTVCVLVGTDGKPEYVSTAGSSGHPMLDGAALDASINWVFTPAKDAKGKKVRCLIYIPVEVKP
ncbi:MAG: energy transducer TonB [Phascolarctobacterium sp.]|nr:energy transducer TonB [Phascolarctobacterium sp.]